MATDVKYLHSVRADINTIAEIFNCKDRGQFPGEMFTFIRVWPDDVQSRHPRVHSLDYFVDSLRNNQRKLDRFKED